MLNPRYSYPTGLIKRLIFVLIFFTVTPIALFASSLSLLALSKNADPTEPNKFVESGTPYGVQIFASLPNNFPTISGEVIGEDARPLLVKEYLSNHDSPLEPHYEFLVKTADKYQLDWRLLPAIAQKESGLCRVIPENSHNCWGWGIHSQGTLKFDSYEEGIEAVAKGLKDNYIDQGYVTVEQIMTKYAHPSSTTWAEGVLQYMEQMN